MRGACRLATEALDAVHTFAPSLGSPEESAAELESQRAAARQLVGDLDGAGCAAEAREVERWAGLQAAQAAAGATLTPSLRRVPRVFVYGTLRPSLGVQRGGWNADAILGPGYPSTRGFFPRGRLYDIGGFPGLARSRRGCAVVGELIAVPPEILARLDRLEGLPEGERRGRVYARRLCKVVTPDGPEWAWCYLIGRYVWGYPIKSGDWDEFYASGWRAFGARVRKRRERGQDNA